MDVVYALEEPSHEFVKSCFLAGPTPRSSEVESWRPDAVKLLEEYNYDGVVFVPEDRSGEFHGNYMHQVEWEIKYLEESQLILFWIPRDLELLPGFTTNVEFGKYLKSGRILMGRPPGTPKMNYLDYNYRKYLNREPVEDLPTLIQQAVEFLS